MLTPNPSRTLPEDTHSPNKHAWYIRSLLDSPKWTKVVQSRKPQPLVTESNYLLGRREGEGRQNLRTQMTTDLIRTQAPPPPLSFEDWSPAGGNIFEGCKYLERWGQTERSGGVYSIGACFLSQYLLPVQSWREECPLPHVLATMHLESSIMEWECPPCPPRATNYLTKLQCFSR